MNVKDVIKKIKIPDWVWQPNIQGPRKAYFVLILLWFAGFILLWIFQVPQEIPRPMDVLRAFPELLHRGIQYDLAASYMLNLKALAFSIVISLYLAYSSKLFVLKAPAMGSTIFRFIGLTGFGLLLTIYFGNGEGLKVAMLTIAITVFYATGMIAEVNANHRIEFDHSRTLRMGEWKVFREVIVYGTLDKAFELLRQNAAMGWMMLTGVEGMVRTGGGVGMVILDANKLNNLSVVYATVLAVLVVGLIQDYGINYLKSIACPWTCLEGRGRK